MKKLLLALIVILAGAGGLWYAFRATAPEKQGETISADRAVTGNYEIAARNRVVLASGARLTIEGDLLLGGELGCENGPLSIVVNGNAKIDGTLSCARPADGVADGDIAAGISLVVRGALIFGKDAVIVSNGQVQIVDSAEKLATTKEAIEAIYTDAGRDSGAGPRIGPFTEEETAPSGKTLPKPSAKIPGRAVSFHGSIVERFVTAAHAQVAPAPCVDQAGNAVPNCVQISGKWVMGEGAPPPPGVSVPTPPKGVDKIILNFNFGENREVHLVDFTLSGPDGRKGTDDKGANCVATGGKGEDAFRLRVLASNIRIRDFNLWLGNGGDGGDAETPDDCDPGKATGGTGGGAGNFKMMASGSFEILGGFNIFPGRGGNGGSATAHGKDGIPACPGAKGGDAEARGGDGGPNKKKLSSAGSVTGTENVKIGEVLGGAGGLANADPGKGGDGTTCSCSGGKGGKGVAIGGRGGDATLDALDGSGTAKGGDGGDADSRGGNGGAGGNCGPQGPGGNGGAGGDASGTAGKGGTGTSAAGDPGTVTSEHGGNGGNGGDGCPEGKGGKGGRGKPPGDDGAPGKNLCSIPPPPATSVEPNPPAGSVTSPTPPSGTTPTPGSGGSSYNSKQVQIIQYQGKYLPVDQLIVEDEAGCGANHWHAAGGVVRATDGTMVPDPGPQCGYGKVSELPAQTITVPQ